jgi:hypothetical protein
MYNSLHQKQESLVLLHHRRCQEASIVLCRYSYAIQQCDTYNWFVRASSRETISIVVSLIFDNIKRLIKYSEISFWHLTQVKCKKWKFIPDINLSPCSECCILSFGWYPGVWILYTDVSEHSVCSIFIGRCKHEIMFDILAIHPTNVNVKVPCISNCKIWRNTGLSFMN